MSQTTDKVRVSQINIVKRYLLKEFIKLVSMYLTTGLTMAGFGGF